MNKVKSFLFLVLLAEIIFLKPSFALSYKAPEISGIKEWINSKSLKISHLKGKVVLIDFWTYSCINCLRTLPHITKWDQMYRDKGLVIIGIHAPEFAFEKNFDNVKKAVGRYNIKYPVALDNDLVTWRNFDNHYWPAHYLIDQSGDIVESHFGEGNYEETENKIRQLLGIKGDAVAEQEKLNFSFGQTAETYLGYSRAQNFYSPQQQINKLITYSFPDDLPRHGWALSGKWKIEKERIVAQEKNAKLRLHFKSKKVFLVMGNQGSQPITVQVKLNGKELKNSPLQVDKHMLYELLSQDDNEAGIVEIEAANFGLEAYAFTFGE